MKKIILTIGLIGVTLLGKAQCHVYMPSNPSFQPLETTNGVLRIYITFQLIDTTQNYLGANQLFTNMKENVYIPATGSFWSQGYAGVDAVAYDSLEALINRKFPNK